MQNGDLRVRHFLQPQVVKMNKNVMVIISYFQSYKETINVLFWWIRFEDLKNEVGRAHDTSFTHISQILFPYRKILSSYGIQPPKEKQDGSKGGYLFLCNFILEFEIKFNIYCCKR